MLKNLQIAGKLALFLVLAGVVLAWADVKLRIYLQDGTLEAGNLVVENPDSFVILGKEGRIEIKKDKIMFINGKTLKQWQDRPDKLFQTEIIPSEIPDPSYVNNKAPIPPSPVKAAAVPVPVIAPVKPIEEVVQPKPAVAEAPAEKEPVEAVAVVAPVVEPVKVVEAPKAAPAPKSKKRNRRPPKEPAPKPEPILVQAPKAVEPPVVRPEHFERKNMSEYHYERGVQFNQTGDTGRALQELHIAAVLNRQNAKAVMLLGTSYLQQGQNEKAKKYLTSPLLKKNENAKNFLDEMEKSEKQEERQKKIFYGGAIAGGLAWLPLLILVRRFRRPTRHVITAEIAEVDAAYEEAKPQVEAMEQAPEEIPEPAFTGFKPMMKPASASQEAAPRSPEGEGWATAGKPPVVPPPVPMQPVVPPPPVMKPILPLPPPVAPPMPPPIVQPALSGLPPEPIAQSPEPAPRSLGEGGNAEGLDVQSVLRLAGMVNRAVRKGNALAVEEKFDLARREYRTALALNPSCVEAYLGLGYMCFAQGQWDLALEHYARALEISPENADAHYGIGRVFLETEHIDEAVHEFQKTLKLDPSFEDARETLTALGALA